MKSSGEIPNAEYILVTDDPKLESKTWNVIYDKSLDGLSTFDNGRSPRSLLSRGDSSERKK